MILLPHRLVQGSGLATKFRRVQPDDSCLSSNAWPHVACNHGSAARRLSIDAPTLGPDVLNDALRHLVPVPCGARERREDAALLLDVVHQGAKLPVQLRNLRRCRPPLGRSRPRLPEEIDQPPTRGGVLLQAPAHVGQPRGVHAVLRRHRARPAPEGVELRHRRLDRGESQPERIGGDRRLAGGPGDLGRRGVRAEQQERHERQHCPQQGAWSHFWRSREEGEGDRPNLRWSRLVE